MTCTKFHEPKMPPVGWTSEVDFCQNPKVEAMMTQIPRTSEIMCKSKEITHTKHSKRSKATTDMKTTKSFQNLHLVHF